MKKFISAFSFLIFSSTALAGPGSTGTRGGGSFAAAQFSDEVQKLIKEIKTYGPIIVSGFVLDGDSIETKFKTTKIWTSNRWLWILDKRVDAINNPQQNWITFSLAPWQRATSAQREQLVLHELIGLTFPDVSDLNYELSSGALQTIHERKTTPPVSLQCSNKFQDWSLTVQDKIVAVAFAGGTFIINSVKESSHVVAGEGLVLSVNGLAGSNQIQLIFNYNADATTLSNLGCSNIQDWASKRAVSGTINGLPINGCCVDGQSPPAPADQSSALALGGLL